MSGKTSVAILYGGKSVEHEVSINSAKNIDEFIDKEKFDVIRIGISKTGRWFLTEKVLTDFSSSQPVTYSLDPQKKGFFIQDSGKHINVDIMFPVLHGTDGEDGSIQGMLTTMGIPFVGTGVMGSAIAMNKLFSKRLMEAADIPVSRFQAYTTDERKSINYEKIKALLGLPFMVKAANLGSSVGVFKISEENDFDHAIAEAFHYDHTVICEAFIEGRELECAVLGNHSARASQPGEIVVSKDYEFYTYEAKYLNPDAAQLVIPADIDEQTAEKIKQLSVKAYQAVGCEDFARVDLFLSHDGEIFINEINTIPGFTNFSMFPMMWKNHGISFTQLITDLIEIAHQRFEKHKNLEKSYKPE